MDLVEISQCEGFSVHPGPSQLALQLWLDVVKRERLSAAKQEIDYDLS